METALDKLKQLLTVRDISQIPTSSLEMVLSGVEEYDDPIYLTIADELERRNHNNIIQGNTVEENVFNPKFLPDLSDDIKDYDWIWENFFAKEHLFLFSSLPKAGKTTFLSSFLKAMDEEKKFLGRKTKKVNTLIISEEAERTWQMRKKMIGAIPIYVFPREFNCGFDLDGWKKLIDDIYKFCIEKKIELVFFDVIDKFWGVKSENDAAEVKDNIPPLFKLTKAGICTVMVQHMRKSGGFAGTATRGSNALTGGVDGIIEFDRYSENNLLDKRRKISIMSRLNFEPIEVLGEFNAETFEYEYLGAKNVYKRNIETNYLLQILPKENEEAMTERTMREESGKSPTKIKNDLKYLLSIEKIAKKNAYVNGRKFDGYVLSGFTKVEDF